MVPIAPLYLWLVLQGGFLCYKLDILVTNFGRIFHYNRINSVLMMKIFHYKGNNLIFYRNFKGIALILMFKLSYFIYIMG